MTNPKLALSEERAVMLPVLAVLGGVVLFILIALGIDTVLVRRVRLEAQLQLEIICKEGSKHLPMAPAALAAVSGRLDDLMNPAMGGNAGIRNSTLTGFRVILPSSSVSLPAGAPFLGGTVTMSATACSYPGVSCSVSRNMVDPVVSANYPPGFWNQYLQANPAPVNPATQFDNNVSGDVIGCEMDLDANTFVSGARPVRVKSVWEARQRGAVFPSPPPSTASPPYTSPPWNLTNPRAQIGGGLTLIISPYMQTRLSQMSIAASGYTDDHTRFDMNNEPLLSTLVPNHSPLSTGSSAPIGFDGQNVPAHFFLNLAPTRPFSIGPAFNPLDEVRASCMNPLVMARNALLQGIVERAQRSYLRDKLEILVANPYHVPITQRAPATNSNANFYPRPQSGLANYENVMRNNSYQTYLRDNPNPPTMVLQGGLDSAAVLLPDGVFTPYVSFNYFDISTQTPVAMNPSATGGNPRDSLIARSLRDCDHLYSQANGRQKPNDATLNNALFEPAMLSVFTQVPFTRLGTYAPGLDPWDRPIVLNPFNLTAGMFVATLGTGQICANGEVQPGSYPPITDPYERQITCQKPDRILNLNLPPSDLRGDLRAALRFVANGTPDAYAITGAGFFPGWPRIANPFNTTSHILIVTHQRITLGEANVLQRLVDQIMTNQPGRAFTVIYMPTNEIDASSNPAFPVTGPPPLPVLGGPPPPPEYAVDLFRRAFRTSNTWCVGDGSAPAASRDPSTGSCRNVLIVLAPRAGGIWNPDVTFRRYWADLIVGTPRSFVPIGGYWPGADIRSLAQRIFTRRLRVERLKS